MAVSYNRAVLISIITGLTIGLMSIENTAYFLNIGVSIRPYYPILMVLSILVGNPIKNKFHNNCYIFYGLIIFTGIFGLFFTPWTNKHNEFINPMIMLIVQMFTFYVLVNAFAKIDLTRFYDWLKIIFRIVVTIPLLVFAINYSSMLGVVGGSSPGIYTGHDGVPRMVGLFADPNYFSLYLIVLISFILYLKAKFNLKLNKIDITFIGIGIIDIFFSFSRSAIATIVLFTVLLLFLKPNKIVLMSLGLLIIVVISICLFLENSILDLVVERFSDTGHDGSSEERIFLLTKGLESPLSYPFGVGVGQCPNYYYSFFNIPKLAHNDFVSVLIECGILGLLSYLLIWTQIFIRQDLFGKIIIGCILIMCCTLTCYAYEPVIPLTFSFYTVFNRYEIKNFNYK